MRWMRWCLVLGLVSVSLGTIATTSEAARVRVVRRGPRRTLVVVRRGYPIHRRMHTVIIRRPNVVVRVQPAVFLPLVTWTTVTVVDRPAADHLEWQDSESLFHEEDWAETVFDCNHAGDKVYLEVTKGRVQFDFAEVVFANGECQVVDFSNGVRDPGLYSLLDFRDGRTVDHVRLIARATSDEAKVALLLAR